MNKLLYLLLLIITLIYNYKLNQFNEYKTENKIEYLPKEVVNNINKYNNKKISLNNVNYTIYYSYSRPRRITPKRNIY